MPKIYTDEFKQSALELLGEGMTGYVNQKWPQYDGFIWPHPRLALAM